MRHAFTVLPAVTLGVMAAAWNSAAVGAGGLLAQQAPRALPPVRSFTAEWGVVVILSALALYAVGRSSRRV